MRVVEFVVFQLFEVVAISAALSNDGSTDVKVHHKAVSRAPHDRSKPASSSTPYACHTATGHKDFNCSFSTNLVNSRGSSSL